MQEQDLFNQLYPTRLMLVEQAEGQVDQQGGRGVPDVPGHLPQLRQCYFPILLPGHWHVCRCDCHHWGILQESNKKRNEQEWIQ